MLGVLIDEKYASPPVLCADTLDYPSSSKTCPSETKP